ncbi:MAG: hypothetical protein ACTTIV_00870 [Campylobacter sp.]
MENFIEKLNFNAQNLDKKIEAETILNLSYEISLTYLNGLDKNAKIAKFSELILEFCTDLAQLNLIADQNIKAVFDGVKRAFIQDEEEYLYRLMSEKERISRQILTQKNEIKELMFDTFNALEMRFANDKISSNLTIKRALNEKMLDETIMKEYLSEISETAFLSAIENNESLSVDVQEKASQRAEKIVYIAACGSEFNREIFAKIITIVINEAVNVANASQIYATELIEGAVLGANLGLKKAVEKFKNDHKFSPIAPSEQLFNPDDETIKVLKNLQISVANPAKEKLEMILAKDFDNYFVKFKRISSDVAQNLGEKLTITAENLSEKLTITAQNLGEKLGEKREKISESAENIAEKIKSKIGEIGSREKIDEINKIASQKLENVISQAKEHTEKLKSNLNNSDKFENFKSKIVKFERYFLDKFENLKNKDNK